MTPKRSILCRDCGEEYLGNVRDWRQRCRPCSGEYLGQMTQAIGAVNAAKSQGLLPRLRGSGIACVDCGKPAHDYDHRDYRKPLEVVPVCRSCNLKRGPADYEKRAA